VDHRYAFASRERFGLDRSFRFNFEVHVDVVDGEARQQLVRASAVLAPLGAVDDGR
jgi:hypothetical protein